MATEEQQSGPFPPVRRVVTGHSPAGQAIIESDEKLIPYDPFSENASPATAESMFGFTTIWSLNLSPFPVTANEPWSEFNGKPVGISNPQGLIARIVDFPPGRPGMMHRTMTVDFGIVLNGEIELELDDGVKTWVKEHDLVVQRGTIHAWNNPGPDTVRMMFLLVSANKLKYGDNELEPTPVPSAFDGSSLKK
ncbi:cupin 2 domain-containing protein [Coccidioides immitis RS]|uniref:Cupin 2 domain-containing protein n=3 Tax=Coccidioides immitis TaxID=5501 RepID=J3K8I0_COCIM|nr:cupin 2 domain-containing protein [Coccidioides immitis RS]EAS31130.3 cupin 2 domain-containing protein [Coccidioides immitis RS]KMP03739.1 hypothetical protein CIRG_03431 [Coccidioides immitis RMSCC 2394]KMU74710.1 hypothetical protein CISG_00640 [Coccidioides immitis RMSCC 3703]TPX23981.1 hypothetical protein DIZ76_013324 [Coccidioides immitis]